jgi:serine-type D-Ala-D-Ala carboxypeptidase/endopeptidase (penicillin-binding protein 4)
VKLVGRVGMAARPRTASFLLLLGASIVAQSGSAACATTHRSDSPAPWSVRLQRLVGDLPISVSVAENGRLIYAHAGDVARPPASDEKLLLSMTLLDRFGPGYRIPTTVEGARPVAGAVAGNLWLVGHGDPEVDDAALARLARKLRTRGIRRVRGAVVGVTNTFTRERWAPGWQPIALQFIAPPTALTFDANTTAAGFVFDPELRAASALAADLDALGVRVHARATAGHAPAAARTVLAKIESAPLIDILRRQNRDSLNFDAEVLTKLLGAASYGAPGTIAKGARAMQLWAQRHGVDAVARDGSGLSYRDAITTNGIVRLLGAADGKPWGGALRSTLPAAGAGTLGGRLLGVRVRAKTGTLVQEVSALSGWVWTHRRRQWAEFSILSHGLSKPQAIALEDTIVSTIARRP